MEPGYAFVILSDDTLVVGKQAPYIAEPAVVVKEKRFQCVHIHYQVYRLLLPVFVYRQVRG